MAVGKRHKLRLKAPIERWDEAVPCGNGLIGTLLWGNSSTLNLSLDRGDLWDLRESEIIKNKNFKWATLKEWQDEKNIKKILNFYNMAYLEPYPTKIPAGRIEIDITKQNKIQSFSLDIKTALFKAEFEEGSFEGFVSATKQVGMFRIKDIDAKVRIRPVPFEEKAVSSKYREITDQDISRLGYPAPIAGKAGDLQWIIQKCSQNLTYAVVVGLRKDAKDITEMAFTIVTSNDTIDFLSMGKNCISKALEKGYKSLFSSHKSWWRNFWNKSSINIPDKKLEQHYYFVQYLYGSGSRPGYPALSLQGLWTADEGNLPPWKGDYHHDLNTQMTYWAYHAANHIEEGACFLDFLWNLFGKAKKFAKDFYGTKGACFPGVMTLDGQPLTGWPQYSLSPTNNAWLAHNFYLHWRYTMDRDFLESRAYPFCRSIAQCLYDLLEPDKNGFLKLPLSSSPEIHDDELKAWMKPNTNYDLSLLKWLFKSVEDMATELNYSNDIKWCQSILPKFEELAVEEESFDGSSKPGSLMVSQDESLMESHRHFSHMMAIYPLGTINIEGSETDKKIIDASFRHIDMLGYGLWVGFSFTWMACMAARCGKADRALTMLELFLKGFVSRNGFNLNGDYKKLGISSWHYRPFTLEANFAAAQAVHEMLLQSWNNVIRIFPTVPTSWEDISFKNLRTEGAFLVSAQRKKGCTNQIQIIAEKGGLLKLRDPFKVKNIKWNRKDIIKKGYNYTCQLRSNEILEGYIGN